MDRQKVILIFGAAAVCAALLTWFLWARTMAPKTEALATVVAAARDLSAGAKLKKGDIKLVRMVARDAPAAALRAEADALDRALLFPVLAGELITPNKLASVGGIEGVAAIIEPGKRAVSVAITDSSGAAGLIQPRSHVDVLFTRTGSMTEAITSTILQNITVLSVGRSTEAQTDSKAARPTTYPVTLLVTPEEAGKLELAKNQGKISLALRNPVDPSRLDEPVPVTGDALDPYWSRPRNRQRPLTNALAARPLDDQAWARLTADAPPPKKNLASPPTPPKVVVDVYRGDKHVQEVFEK